jgi:exodeoxyribonuclease V alpha subunit
MDRIEGMIERVLFHNKDNGYTVASFLIDFNKIPISVKKAKIFGNKTTVVGVFDRQPVEDEEFILEGEFVKDPKFGLQFKFVSFERKDFESQYGIINYLSSDLFPGVGLKAATIIVEALGLDAIKKIKADPKCLDGVGISKLQKQTIINGVIKDDTTQQSIIFLLNHGVTIDMANRIINALEGLNVKDIVSENPYMLIDRVERFGFKKADALASSIGIPKTATCRLKALLCYSLKEVLYSSGNSYISKSDLYIAINKLTGDEIEKTKFQDVLNMLELEKKIFIDKNDNVFDYANYQAEVDLAVELAALLKNERNGAQGIPQYEEKEINKIFESIKKESHIEFSPEQEEAIKMAFTEPIVIITGGPGTGKTTIVHAILKMYLKLNKDNSTLAEAIALLAPTGRAAKRLKESTNMPASTIHKFLGYQGENYFQYSKTNRTNARLIIVDEASMMDLPLASRLITSMHNSARLIIVGDVDQLPSVGPGQVLKDLIDSKEIKTIRLNKIHRQAADSSIIKLAHNINEGILPENLLDKLSDRNFIATSNEALPSMIVDLYVKAIEKGKSIKDTQVLIPMYKGETGINEINNRIQEAINPSNGGTELKHLNRVFRLRDKVIQLVNRAEKGVMNGDIGYVSGFTKKNDKISGVEVSFDLHVVSYELEELDDLTLAYAISIHKSQGSEFELVIMPFTTQYYVMLKRKLIYTGITRAKKTLLLIGDPQAMHLGIRKIEIERKTILKEELKKYLYSDSISSSLSKLLNDIDNDLQEDELGAIETIIEEEDFN